MEKFKLLFNHLDAFEESSCEKFFTELIYYIHQSDYKTLFTMLMNPFYLSVINIRPYANWEGNIGFSILHSFDQYMRDGFVGGLEIRYAYNLFELMMLFKSFGMRVYQKDYYEMTCLDYAIEHSSRFNDKSVNKFILHMVPFYKKPIRNGDVIFIF